MRIIKFKKSGNSKYIVELENSKSLVLYEEVLIKYNLLYSKKIDIDKLNEILEFNDYAASYDDALKYISKRMRSKKEVEEYLLDKEYSPAIVKDCINRLVNNNILNEEMYVKSYINDRFYLSKDGPYKICRDLENMGIDVSIISENISNISDIEIEDKVKRYIEKKRTINSKYSSSMFNQKVKNELINLGFDKEIIEKYLSYDEDDIEQLKKEYNKIYKKYFLKYSGVELTMKLKSFLYSKGYKMDDINKVIK